MRCVSSDVSYPTVEQIRAPQHTHWHDGTMSTETFKLVHLHHPQPHHTPMIHNSNWFGIEGYKVSLTRRYMFNIIFKSMSLIYLE